MKEIRMLSLNIFFMYQLLMNVAFVQSQTAKSIENEDPWISKVGDIGENLLAVQTFLVKDEISSSSHKCTPRDRPFNSSDKLYLMCVGSILSVNLILTSAYCLYEAQTIRHNIRGSLSAIIAPLTKTPQVIKIEKYFYHPEHELDPRKIRFTLHNVAVVKLSCRIFEDNLNPIQLPTQALADLCADDNCIVAIISKITPLSFNIYQTNATNINYGEAERIKRNFIYNISSIEIFNETTNPLFNYKKTGQVLQSNNHKSVEKNINKRMSINVTSTKFVKRYITGNKRLSIRSSNGVHGCPLEGSAVMLDNVQVGLVALGCDDRQPDIPSQYTDLYSNVDWINKILQNEVFSSLDGSPCSRTYNFYFGNQPSKHCPKFNLKALPVEQPDCQSSEFSTNYPIYKKKIPNNEQYLNVFKNSKKPIKFFNKEIYKLYNIHKNNPNNDNVNEGTKISKKNFNPETSINNNTLESAEVLRFLFDALESVRNSKYISHNNINSYDLKKEHEIHDKRRNFNINNYNNNYGQGNNINTNDIKNERNIKNINQHNLSKEKKNLSFEEYLKKNQYEESKIPETYLFLYKKFLEDQNEDNKY